ncbi:hypothetical protein GCM10022267_76020 [Lentzea roselyniae]|uniref:Uncharacterized protein n=1 Tax=Lentzea roselyniae TaxID=531940 RepID=A0ABP7C640_9PSEU
MHVLDGHVAGGLRGGDRRENPAERETETSGGQEQVARLHEYPSIQIREMPQRAVRPATSNVARLIRYEPRMNLESAAEG